MSRFEHHPRLHRNGRPSTTGGFVFGIAVIGIGTVMLLNTLGIIDAHDVWAYIPLVLVALGIFKIVEAQGSPAGLAFGGILALGGALWFFDNVGVLSLDKRLIPPVILIAFGLMFLIRAIERRRWIETGGVPPSSDSSLSLFTMFGGVKRFSDARDFRGGDAFSIFGGIEIDLRAALIAERAILDANAIFGGVEIRVPLEWVVEVKGAGIFGGYEDNTVHPANPETAPRLIVTGFALFGGVSVKNA